MAAQDPCKSCGARLDAAAFERICDLADKRCGSLDPHTVSHSGWTAARRVSTGLMIKSPIWLKNHQYHDARTTCRLERDGETRKAVKPNLGRRPRRCRSVNQPTYVGTSCCSPPNHTRYASRVDSVSVISLCAKYSCNASERT